jgi:hypothetical protein
LLPKARTKKRRPVVTGLPLREVLDLLAVLPSAKQHANAWDESEHRDGLGNALVTLAGRVSGSYDCSCENDENDCGDFVHNVFRFCIKD